MKQVKKILAAIDLSEHSLETVRFAADLACRYAAELSIVHVYQPALQRLADGLASSPPLPPPPEAVQHLATAKQEALAAGAQRVEIKLVAGAASAEIVHLAGEHGYDMIVMGTYARRGADHVLFGSVTESVLRTAPCPLVSIRLVEAAARTSSPAAPPSNDEA